MKVEKLIEELKKLDKEANIVILDEEGHYCLEEFVIINTKDKDVTYISEYEKSEYDYFFASAN
ncbi:UNVERIFIED_ORG: hypothetical protein B2H93_04345 [Clostridium botulinum]